MSVKLKSACHWSKSKAMSRVKPEISCARRVLKKAASVRFNPALSAKSQNAVGGMMFGLISAGVTPGKFRHTFSILDEPNMLSMVVSK